MVMRTSYNQYLILVAFMEQNGDLSRPLHGLGGRKRNEQQWTKLKNLLNNTGSGGVRTERGWRRVWTDYKNNVKRKYVKLTHTSSHGGSPNVQITDLEQRVLHIIGTENIVSNVPGSSIDTSKNTQSNANNTQGTRMEKKDFLSDNYLFEVDYVLTDSPTPDDKTSVEDAILASSVEVRSGTKKNEKILNPQNSIGNRNLNTKRSITPENVQKGDSEIYFKKTKGDFHKSNPDEFQQTFRDIDKQNPKDSQDRNFTKLVKKNNGVLLENSANLVKPNKDFQKQYPTDVHKRNPENTNESPNARKRIKTLLPVSVAIDSSPNLSRPPSETILRPSFGRLNSFSSQIDQNNDETLVIDETALDIETTLDNANKIEQVVSNSPAKTRNDTSEMSDITNPTVDITAPKKQDLNNLSVDAKIDTRADKTVQIETVARMFMEAAQNAREHEKQRENFVLELQRQNMVQRQSERNIHAQQLMFVENSLNKFMACMNYALTIMKNLTDRN